jgi:hypothetical protein
MVMDEADKVDKVDREDMVEDMVADMVEDKPVDNNHMDMTCSTMIKVYFNDNIHFYECNEVDPLSSLLRRSFLRSFYLKLFNPCRADR